MTLSAVLGVVQRANLRCSGIPGIRACAWNTYGRRSGRCVGRPCALKPTIASR